MNEYYDELYRHGDPVIAAGWRHRLEQMLRYEVALDALAFSPETSLLDVGCGPGNLYAYLEATGRVLHYTGIDRLSLAVAHARARFPNADFMATDVFSPSLDQQRFDAVLAVGTLVSGVSAPDDAARIQRMTRLVERGFALSQRVFCLVVLNEEVVESRAALRSEPALLGAFTHELEALGLKLATNYAVRTDFLQTDLALYLWQDEAPAPSWLNEAPFVAHERVLNSLWGREATPLERAWLWLEAGAWERAAEILDGPCAPTGEQADLFRARLAHGRR
ncbi:MAG: class I SAM-dependent methyltransferase [Bradymonadaceae bacterium]|nr:class I SAM-dependent methyltransferase [Lujinxingiaceae bacterium]